MTMQAEELLGTQVIGADGKAVGTVEQVFGNDADGTPVWARIRSGRASRFVPLGSSRVTRDGLNVPFDAQQIMAGPKIEVGDHMSAEQAEELVRYFGTTIPAQQRGKSEGGKSEGGKAEEGQQRGKAEEAKQEGGEDWLVRREERLQVGTETVESGRVKLHRYVDDDTAEQTVHLVHEEYDIEREPVAEDEGAEGDLGEDEQQIILHTDRVILSKDTVPVERIRLVPKTVEEDKTVQDAIRRERIEVEPEEFEQPEEVSAGGRARSRSRS